MSQQPPYDDRPARVRITSPRTIARPHRVRTIEQEIDEETRIGEVYMASLMRSQLRLALGVILFLAATIGPLPLVFVGVPGINDVRPLGVPLPWLLLGLVVYPVLFAAGYAYVRQAERAERTFSELVERP